MSQKEDRILLANCAAQSLKVVTTETLTIFARQVKILQLA